MDDVLEFAARFLLRCLLGVLQCLAQLILEFVLFYTGRVVVAVLTLGGVRTISLAECHDDRRRTVWQRERVAKTLSLEATIGIGTLPYVAAIAYFILR